MDNFSLDDLGLRVTGRPAAPLTFNYVRDLGEEDLHGLQNARESSAPGIVKLRERHHALAKLLVQGVSPGDAGIATGYSNSRVSILQADPTFQELMAFYREGVQERFYTAQEAMAALALDSTEELRERLDDTPDEFSVAQLLDMSKFAMDRTGNGPSTKQEVNIKVGLADRLAAARTRVSDQRALKDVTPKELPNEPCDRQP